MCWLDKVFPAASYTDIPAAPTSQVTLPFEAIVRIALPEEQLPVTLLWTALLSTLNVPVVVIVPPLSPVPAVMLVTVPPLPPPPMGLPARSL